MNQRKLTTEEKHINRIKRREEARLKKEQEAKAKEQAQLLEDEKYMREAIKLARKGAKLGEVPIGAVIVYEGEIIGRGYNRRKNDKSTLSHAEITAIKRASKKLDDWRLEGCTIYITLEPCQMCAGAIVQARIPRCVFASSNPKAGCGGSIINILQMDEFNHKVNVTRGVLEKECSSILTEFFGTLRKHLKQKDEEKTMN